MRGVRAVARRCRGITGILAIVMWVVALAFVYALMLGTSHSGALGAVARMSGLRGLILAAQSALEETSVALRFPGGASPSSALEAIRNGSASGLAHDPDATRAALATVARDMPVALDGVRYEVVFRPSDPASTEAWLIDFIARARLTAPLPWGRGLTYQVRRRHTARLRRILETRGPRAGQVIYVELILDREAMFEVLEP